ncbi:hypothetical protein BDIM_18350 [Brevundimonas diminuta ATCC 11568]|nr:hypothetical protein BDIM_18350 [Brevundimonas diminuta ATCC 11568]
MATRSPAPTPVAATTIPGPISDQRFLGVGVCVILKAPVA